MAELTVLGVGNLLLRDEGVGVHVLRALQQRCDDPRLELIDGGAAGLGLLNVIERSNRLLIIDAARMGLAPGQWRSFSPSQVRERSPAGGEKKPAGLSLHDCAILEVLMMVERFGRLPPTTILGIEPELIEHGTELSPTLAANMQRYVQAAMKLIEQLLGGSNRPERPAC